jgi:hypothetical protein
MSAKTVLAAVLLGAWLNCSVVRGQDPEGAPPARAGSLIPAEQPGEGLPGGPAATFGPPGPAAGPPGSGMVPNAALPPGTACGGVLPTNTGLSDWILYRRDNGCTTSGGGRPMMVEVFLRSGVSVPVGGTLLGRELDTGWRIEGGGRSLFFNQDWTKAWTVDLNIVNVNNGAIGQQQIPLSVFVPNTATGVSAFTKFGQGGVPGVTLKGLNRTMAGGGIGREWYLWAPANAPGSHWRIGTDFGARYGSERADFNEIRHRTHVIENGYVAFHTDLEKVCGHCIWYTGLRFEWDYTASSILQRQSDFQDLNALLTLGVRY